MGRPRGPVKHGTRGAYYGWSQCRCRQCRDAVAEYQRNYRANNPDYVIQESIRKRLTR